MARGLYFTGGTFFTRFLLTRRLTQAKPHLSFFLSLRTKLSHEVRPRQKRMQGQKKTDSRHKVFAAQGCCGMRNIPCSPRQMRQEDHANTPHPSSLAPRISTYKTHLAPLLKSVLNLLVFLGEVGGSSRVGK